MKKIVSLYILLVFTVGSYANFSLSGNIITQSNTDANLSGLIGIAGVTTLSIGSGADGRTIYSIGNRILVITGTLNINPELEAVYAGTGSPRSVFDISGTLNINGEITENGVIRYSTQLFMWSPYQSGSCCGNFGLRVRSTANLNWKGGAIRVGSAVSFDGGANVNTTGAILFQDKNGDNQVRQSSSNWTCNSFKFTGNDVTFIAVPALLNGYEPIGARGALGFSSSTPNIDFPVNGFSSDGSSDSDIRFWRGNRPILTNAKFGSKLKAVPHISGSGSSYGVAIIEQEVQVSIVNGDGLNVAAAKIYTIDTNNGNREVYNKEGHVVDATADKVYNQTTLAAGKTTVYQIITAYNIINTGNGDAINTGNYAWDYRGNSNDDSDIFTFNVASYNYNFSSFNSILKGLNTVETGTTVFTDNSITEITKATVDAYTAIENSVKFYDRAKAFLTDTYAGETAPLVARTDATIDAGNYNVVIDATAATAFAFDGTTITLKSIVYTGNISTTGLVTTANGATIEGGYADSSGTYKFVYLDWNENKELKVAILNNDTDIEIPLTTGTSPVTEIFKGHFKMPSTVPTPIRIEINSLITGALPLFEVILPDGDLSYINKNVFLFNNTGTEDNQYKILRLSERLLAKTEAIKSSLNETTTPSITITETITNALDEGTKENQETILRLLKRLLNKVSATREAIKED